MHKRTQLARIATAALVAASCHGTLDGRVADDAAVDPDQDAAVVDGAIGGARIDAALIDARPGAIDASVDARADATVDARTDASVDARPATRDVTFYAVADTHADPPTDSYDLRATARAINAVAQNGTWPASIGGQATGFTGGRIAPPSGVVLLGDITGWGTAPTEIPTFRHYFEAGNSGDSIAYPAYVGLGNHDVDDADRPPDVGAAYRAMYWSYVDSRHKGGQAAVKAAQFDAASHAYAWEVGGVHFIQTHRFPGDHGYGLASSLDFVRAELDRAGPDQPVVLFHHYGMDPFGSEERWWTAADRRAYHDALRGHTVAAIFAGHSHAAMQYTWEGLRVFHANNAKAEINTGNRDGNGSFAIVRITDSRLEVVTCRWLDDAGHYELIGPFYSGPANPGRAP